MRQGVGAGHEGLASKCPSRRRASFPGALDQRSRATLHRGRCNRLPMPNLALSYVDFKDEHGHGSAAKLFTRDEARHMAINFAK